jgi:hypothetical protein
MADTKRSGACRNLLYDDLHESQSTPNDSCTPNTGHQWFEVAFCIPAHQRKTFLTPFLFFRASVFEQKMNVVGCDHIIENGKAVPLLGLEHPAQVTAPITHSEAPEV